MRSTVENLEGNKVKLVVELDDDEFEQDLEAAFKRIGKDVKLPGFRQGKTPRKVLEARIGQGYARQEAFRESLPGYYTKAVIEHEVDVIAPPEFDITSGQESGPVQFDAVVEVRPSLDVDGYKDFEVEVQRLEITDDEVEETIDRFRSQFAENVVVDRPADDGDRVLIDIEVVHEGETVPGMTSEDYMYEVGSGATGFDSFDENLRGAESGNERSFSEPHPDEDESAPLEFSLKVKEVQEIVLPDTTDEWASDNTEFASFEDLKADYRAKLERSRLIQVRNDVRNKIADQVTALVSDDDLPEAMVTSEFESRVQDMAMRLGAQGMSFDQYLQLSGQDRDEVLAGARSQADAAARLDLALRAIANQERIDLDDAELEAEIIKVSEQFDRPSEEVKTELKEAGQLAAVRADLIKSKTLDWLVAETKVVDEDGRVVSQDELELPGDDDDPNGSTGSNVENGEEE